MMLYVRYNAAIEWSISLVLFYLASSALAAMTLSTSRVPMERIAARYALPDSPCPTRKKRKKERKGWLDGRIRIWVINEGE